MTGLTFFFSMSHLVPQNSYLSHQTEKCSLKLLLLTATRLYKTTTNSKALKELKDINSLLVVKKSNVTP